MRMLKAAALVMTLLPVTALEDSGPLEIYLGGELFFASSSAVYARPGTSLLAIIVTGPRAELAVSLAGRALARSDFARIVKDYKRGVAKYYLRIVVPDGEVELKASVNSPARVERTFVVRGAAAPPLELLPETGEAENPENSRDWNRN